MSESESTAFFVYGTLKRGERNVGVWPHSPVLVVNATTPGELYDLGPYPAMRRGPGVVAGELWLIEEPHVQATLRSLDALESFNPAKPSSPSNEYERAMVRCECDDGEERVAWTYFYVRELPEERRVGSLGGKPVRWTGLM